MEIRPEVLRKELAAVSKQIEAQIAEVKTVAEGLGMPPSQLRDMHGNWVMLPLVVAKANVVTAMVELNKPSRPR